MNLREIIQAHDPDDAFATVQRMVDYADEYKVLFGFRHQWLWSDGGKAQGDVTVDKTMQVTWWLDGEPDGFYLDTSDRKREPANGPELYVAVPKVKSQVEPEGTVFSTYSRGVATGNDALMYDSDKGEEQHSVFHTYSMGVKTCNDALMYNSSRDSLTTKVSGAILQYELARAAVEAGIADVDIVTSHSPRWRPTKEEHLACLDWLIEEAKGKLRKAKEPEQTGLF